MALQSLIQELIASPSVPALLWQRVLGHLASFVDLVPNCRLLMRPLQLHFLRFFSPLSDSQSKLIPLSQEIKVLCAAWRSPVSASRRETCNDIPCDPYSASLGQIADFLVFLFDKGLAISTIRVYRSAIASCHMGFQDGSSISGSSVLTKLCKSFFLKRPPIKTLLPAWSLPCGSSSSVKSSFRTSSQGFSSLSGHQVCFSCGHRFWSQDQYASCPLC